VGWGKVVCWSTKAAISLKRVKIEEKLLWRAYRNSLPVTLFRVVPSPTPYGLCFPKIGGSLPHPKLQSLLSQERVKLRTSNLADTFTGSIRTKPIKILEKWERGRIQGLSNFWGTPIISGTGKATDFRFGRYIHGVYRNESSPLKILEKRERGCIQGLLNFLGYPYYLRNG